VQAASGNAPNIQICFILHSAQFSYPLARFQTFKPDNARRKSSAAFEAAQSKKKGATKPIAPLALTEISVCSS